MYDSDGGGSPSQSAMMKVAKLVDSYLAEIAPDANLKLSKFIALAEILPDYARVVDDGLYRAIDIYLKVLQPILTPAEMSLYESALWFSFLCLLKKLRVMLVIVKFIDLAVFYNVSLLSCFCI